MSFNPIKQLYVGVKDIVATLKKEDELLQLKYLTSNNNYIYLATVYSKHSKGIHQAFEEAARAASWFVEKGIHVFCPIAHTHPIAIYGKLDPKDHDLWMPADAPFIAGATGLVVVKMPGWKDSVGIGMEIESFEKAGKPIFYFNWPLDEKV